MRCAPQELKGLGVGGSRHTVVSLMQADQPPPPKKHGGPWYAPSQDLKVKAKEAQPPQQEPGEQQHVGPWLAPNQAHKLNASAAKPRRP